MTAPAAPDPPVRLAAVVKHYGRRTVLDGVGFDVLPGVTGLIGPNGAGKSTLVRAILGLVRLAGGTVRVFGRDPAAAPRAVRRLVGVVPEDDCAIPGLSGVEMVRYAGRLSGLPATEALRRAHEVLDWCDAGQERYRPVETLAVGVRQKVAFAAALVHDPALLILDEPTNGLDPLERRAMLGRLVTLAREHGKTVLVSTHVLRDVQAVCDHAVLLVRGRVRLRGAVADLTAAAAGGALRLEGTGPLGALAAALAARGIPARPAAADDPALLVGTAADAAPTVWRCARETGVTVTALGPAHRDLEEVFLAALGGDGADAENTHAAP